MNNRDTIIDFIIDMLINGTMIKNIKKDTMKKFNLNESDFRNLLSDAKAEIGTYSAETEDISLDIQLQRLHTIYEYAEKADNIRLMLEVQKEIDKIRGLQQQNIKADIDSDFTVSFQ